MYIQSGTASGHDGQCCQSNRVCSLIPLMLLILTIKYREAQCDGIWAWDCEHKKLILIFPTVLALLGDNPMHSEFACHIGLQGKFFCHSCWVKGSDADDVGNMPNLGGSDSPQNSPVLSSPGSEAEIDHIAPNDSTSEALPDGSTSTQPSSRKRKKYKESYSAMLDRVSAFVKVCLIFQC